MEWGAAVAAVFGLLLYILKRYDAGKPGRDSEARDEAIQQGRRDILDSNVAAVNDRIDRLLDQSDHTPGQSSGPVTSGRLSAVLRVATARRGAGADPGRGGEVPK
jgi:hypothetical protein